MEPFPQTPSASFIAVLNRGSVRGLIAAIMLLGVMEPGLCQASGDLAANQAARDLVATIGGGAQVTRILTAMRGGMIQAIVKTGKVSKEKAVSAVDDILMPAMKAHVDELTPGIVAIYAGSFSIAELKQLNGFYQMPLGRKLLEKQPTIGAEAVALGQEWGGRIVRQTIENHRQELLKRGISL